MTYFLKLLKLYDLKRKELKNLIGKIFFLFDIEKNLERANISERIEIYIDFFPFYYLSCLYKLLF